MSLHQTTSAPPHAIPLWRQLNAVASVLIAVRAGKSWTTAQLDVENALRPGVQALSFAVLRHYGTALALRVLLASRTPTVAADALLCSTLALALESGLSLADAPVAPAVPGALDKLRPQGGASYAAHTLVSQAVEAAKRNPATQAQASFINACLRRFLRERDALLVQALRQPQAAWNHPAWWVQRVQREYPQHWQALLQANAHAAPLTLRINSQKTSVADYLRALQAMQLEASVVANTGLELGQSSYVPALPGYADGWFSVQDAAAQLAAPLLLDAVLATNKASHARDASNASVAAAVSTQAQQTRLRVLDACAAPGGKTAHLLEYAASQNLDVDVLAIDVDASRCVRIQENLARLQLAAQVLAADAAQPSTWWDGQPFDAILLDAPCTASAGYAVKRTLPAWRRSKKRCSRRCGPCSYQAPTCCTALVPFSRPRAKIRYKRFLRTTKTLFYCHLQGICWLKARRRDRAYRTII
jgi:16S rRNA (cytosine967-C5)-methyltransferase